MSGPLQTVHVRVNDAATGKPTPCRVRFTDADGNYYAPLGRLAEFATGPNQDVGGNVLLGAKAYAYIDGACEINLPPGPLRVEICKGPEYRPVAQDVTLAAGKLSLRFEIARWIDLRAEGWYSGDTRVHFLSPHAALLEAQAEDVAVVNLLAAPTQIRGPFDRDYQALPNILAFSGQQFALQSAGHGVAVNTLNRHPELGSLALLHCHRVVYPLSFGGPHGKDDWTLADWCDQCHRKGGLVVWADPLHESPDFRHGEPLADLILGKVDAFEVEFWEDSPFDVLADWYTLLAAGLRVPLVGASGKDSNGSALGVLRTYAQLQPGEAFDYRNWIEAVRAGRTFVTNGPLLTLTVEGGERLFARAEARSWVPFQHLELLWNGEVLVSVAPDSGPPYRASVEIEHRPGDGGWFAARCRGEQQVFDRPSNQRVFAHTSPVYVGELPVRREAVQTLLAELDRMLDWVENQARCDTPKQRADLAGVFRSARQELLRKI